MADASAFLDLHGKGGRLASAASSFITGAGLGTHGGAA